MSCLPSCRSRLHVHNPGCPGVNPWPGRGNRVHDGAGARAAGAEAATESVGADTGLLLVSLTTKRCVDGIIRRVSILVPGGSKIKNTNV
eukprot:193488-Chlamydomonas_euryale.AAC.1